ncbi:hypothetical protein ACPTIM_14335 [Enterococcus faecalis]|uniref:hypothetical protein n=1 Tax=Enterococcus faecalis TaxID=1351 RepID=UPI002F3E0FDE|nr:hypothetical protein [Lactobacillus sp.]
MKKKVWRPLKDVDNKGNLVTKEMKETEIELDEKAFDEKGKLNDKEMRELNKKGIVYFDNFRL